MYLGIGEEAGLALDIRVGLLVQFECDRGQLSGIHQLGDLLDLADGMHPLLPLHEGLGTTAEELCLPLLWYHG